MTSGAPDLDPLLHNAPRIAIVSRLLLFEVVRFAKLRDLTGLTPGNLATHLDSLERGGYIQQRDAFIAKRPGKIIALTPQGREAFSRYVANLQRLLQDLQTMPVTAKVAGPTSTSVLEGAGDGI